MQASPITFNTLDLVLPSTESESINSNVGAALNGYWGGNWITNVRFCLRLTVFTWQVRAPRFIWGQSRSRHNQETYSSIKPAITKLNLDSSSISILLRERLITPKTCWHRLVMDNCNYPSILTHDPHIRNTPRMTRKTQYMYLIEK